MKYLRTNFGQVGGGGFVNPSGGGGSFGNNKQGWVQFIFTILTKKSRMQVCSDLVQNLLINYNTVT